MPRKTKEAKDMPVKDTKKDTRKITTKTIKNVDSASASKSKPSSTKISKTTKSKNTPENLEISKVEKDSETKSTKLRQTKSVKSTKTVNTKDSKKSKITKTKSSKTGLVSVIEYYDLPYRYNQTIVKILAQTPKMLFVYWDISDDDRKNFEEHYGNDFFTTTKPVLIIRNETMNYSFEIEINDFANSWYLHVNDADCKYTIELGRRPYTRTSMINTDYIYVSSSNEITSPNNHILFEKFNPSVTYKNTKNGQFAKREFSSLASYKNIQAIYNIYDLYKTIYNDNLFYEITNEDLINPSSLSSSSFK